jgi:5'(3')-deoxyribonucleotidase
MKVLLDVDGVLANFVQGACDEHGLENPYLSPASAGHYDIVKLLGVPDKEFWAPLGRDFWANLPKMEHADVIVELLELTYGRDNICILTKPCKTEGCADGKIIWLRENYPQFHFLLGSSKSWCAHPGSILFDDFGKNITRFRQSHGRAFLVPAPWNHMHGVDTLKAISSFLEAERAVLNACS